MASHNPGPTERTTVRRGASRAEYDPEVVRSIIDATPICHVAVNTDRGPIALPMAHGRIDDVLYVHGALANAMLRAALGGGMCATFTELDGLVVARSPFHNSMNYRCAVVVGMPREVRDRDEKLAALRAVCEHVAPAWGHGRPPNDAEIRRTLVLAVGLDEASAKVRAGDPVDEPEDVGGPWWAGTIPLQQQWGRPVTAMDGTEGVEVPAALVDFTRGSSG
ncbi:MAG: pyridoxamine 5'-phosphate oxidase family protein [Actinomycetia bacterium]|nr:pyridoxamine 5'-phosphate oxidase family protein [Actinomycetes bacterium]